MVFCFYKLKGYFWNYYLLKFKQLALSFYFQFHQTPQIQVIRLILSRLNELEAFFSKQTSYHFFSSSLLLAYDAKYMDNIDKTRVIFADFAHVFPGNNQIDENYLYGLQRLIFYLKELVKPDFKFNINIIKEMFNSHL